MTAWWSSRTVRERMLLAAAAFFLAVAVIWQFVLRPAIDTLERAKLEHERAAQTLARVDRIGTLIEQGHMILPALVTPEVKNMTDLRTEASRIAQENGLTAQSSESQGSSSLDFLVKNASGPDFFKWIEQVETRLGLTVNAASVQQNTDGGLDADIQFSLDGRS